jgi:hypothetical protein
MLCLVGVRKETYLLGAQNQHPPLAKGGEFNTTDVDWRHAIVLRLQQESMHTVLKDLLGYNSPPDVKEQLYDEIVSFYGINT